MPPILPSLQIPGASDNQESDLDKEIVERNVEAMRNKKSEELFDSSDFNLVTFEAFLTARNREDLDSIASGTRTDGDCSETEAISSLYESHTRVVIPPTSHPHISQNSHIPGLVDYAASWFDDVEGRSDMESAIEEFLYPADWSWDYTRAFNNSEISEMQGTKYREDIDSIVSCGTNTDGCSENEAVSRVYESDNTVQRPRFSFSENGEGIKRNSWEYIGSATKQYRSTSGAYRAGNQHGSSFTGDRNTEEILYSAPEIILKEAAQNIEHGVADHREAQTSKFASIREEESGKNISHTYENLSQHFGRPLDDARKSFGVSRTAFKAMCRDVGIKRWKYGKRNMGRHSSETRRRINEEVPGKSNFSSGVPPAVAHTSLNLKKIIVKATYNGAHIRFRLSDSSGISELEENVMKRLHLERNTFTLKYQDDDGEWIIIACDEDVQECIEISRISKTIIKMLIERPVDYYAP